MLLSVLTLGCGLAWLAWECRDIGAGYCAKILATGVFVLHRSPESICAEELKYFPFDGYTVDHEAKTVTAWVFPSVKRTAVYREGLGVALAFDDDLRKLQAQARPNLAQGLERLKELPWPMGDAPNGKPRPTGYDAARLNAAVDKMFAEPYALNIRNTRAGLIAYRGEIVAEKYAEGFGPDQRLAGWSASKSIFHALFGIAVRDGKVKPGDLAPFPAWRAAGDPRSGITLDTMLHMQSGIALSDFDFERRPLLGELLFSRGGAAEFFTARPLAHAPGTHFAYSSGCTNALSWVLRQAYGDDAYYAMPYKELFSKIGMRSAVLEADATGTLIGSSYGFATARDFIRFGLLYQNDGMWQGERILPEGWVKHAYTPAPGMNSYGAHWWLLRNSDPAQCKARGIKFPSDGFIAAGYEGQKLVVIPSLQLVVLRLGLCYFSDYPVDEVIYDVLDAIQEAHIT